MRPIAYVSSLLLAFLLPSHADAQNCLKPLTLSQADAAAPPPKTEPRKTETKPFSPHTGHAAHDALPAARPWFDLAGVPPPNRAANLGKHRYEITVANDGARTFFDQGLIYAYGFNHLEALRSFVEAQKLDSNCAMCFWGEAYVLGPNLNMPMDPAAETAARAAAETAVAKAANASAREQALTAALLARYAGPGDRADLDRKYAKIMQSVAQTFPDDPDIATLAAESLMLLSPWDYWTDGGRTPKDHAAAALRLLEGALAANPGHIAAIHYYIHLVEASDRPERAEPYADRLRAAAPDTGHLLHMPAHIYLRLGRYKDALEVNKDAAESDERYFAANPAVHGPYRAMYYPHNVHFYMTAALMAGQRYAALSSAEKLARLIPDETAQAVALAQPIKQAPYFVHAQFSDPKTILALPEPSEKLPFVVAAWRYARGVAYALKADPARAEQEAAAIGALASADFSALEEAQIPARGVLDIAEKVVRAKAAAARGDLATARQLAEAAVSAQDSLPYMEPPYWYVPVNQTLGAILLKSGAPHEAAAAFKAACGKAPNSAWAIYGLMQAQAAAGDSQAADEARRRFDKARADGGQEPSLDRM